MPRPHKIHPSSAVLCALEQQMEKETILHFEERLTEGYDLVHDPLYNVWSKLEKAVSKFSESAECTSTEKEDNSDPIPELSKLSIAPAFEEELKVPKPVQQKKTRSDSYKQCATWYHVQSTDIDSKDLDTITWLCHSL